jgi:hypothetical protein
MGIFVLGGGPIKKINHQKKCEGCDPNLLIAITILYYLG